MLDLNVQCLQPGLSRLGVVKIENLVSLLGVTRFAGNHQVLNCTVSTKRNRLDMVDCSIALWHLLATIETTSAMYLMSLGQGVLSSPRTTLKPGYKVKRNRAVAAREH